MSNTSRSSSKVSKTNKMGGNLSARSSNSRASSLAPSSEADEPPAPQRAQPSTLASSSPGTERVNTSDQEVEVDPDMHAPSGDEGELDPELQAMVEGQMRLQRIAEELAARLQMRNQVMEGQRRLEQQITQLSQVPRAGPTGFALSADSDDYDTDPHSPIGMRGRRRPPSPPERGSPSPPALRSPSPPDRRSPGAPKKVHMGPTVSVKRYEMPAAGDVEQGNGMRVNWENAPRKDVMGDFMSEESMHSSLSKGSSKGRGHGMDGSQSIELRPGMSMTRKALRLISLRRRETMEQLHGDSALHISAWIAEVITCFLFTVAMFIMLGLWVRHVNEEAFINTFFVTAIAAMTYFAKSCHMGDMQIIGHNVPLARYIDWITTTPLMLYEVCHIAHASAAQTIMVIMCDLLMLATGIIAALVPWRPHKGLKQIWFGMSCYFYILMLVVIQWDVAYKASKQIEPARELFLKLKYLTIIVWSFYPIIVGAGRAHLGLIAKPTEDILLCILDVVSKLGMEGIIVVSCFNGCIEAGAH